MKYILDTVDKNEINKWKYLITGVTSNPILLEKANLTQDQFLEMMTSNFPELSAFVQVSSYDEAMKINEKYFDKKIIYKIPMYIKYHNDIIKMKKEWLDIAATTIYDIVQINQAIEFGLTHTMVYYAKNYNNNLLEEAVKLKNITGSEIKLIAASFRTKRDVENAILSGVEYSTIPPNVMEIIFKNTNVKEDVGEIEKIVQK